MFSKLFLRSLSIRLSEKRANSIPLPSAFYVRSCFQHTDTNTHT